MTASFRSLIADIRVALTTPSYIERRLPELIQPAAQREGGVSDPSGAVKAAHRALRYLARIPGAPWRNTCLYRGVAECLLLRAHGIPARLCIGVESLEGSVQNVGAHAWVETDGEFEAAAVERPRASTVPLVGSRLGRRHEG